MPAVTGVNARVNYAANAHVDVSWSTYNGASGYRVYASPDSSATPDTVADLPTTLTFTSATRTISLDTLVPGTTYSIFVVALVADNVSVPSNAVTVTAQPAMNLTQKLNDTGLTEFCVDKNGDGSVRAISSCIAVSNIVSNLDSKVGRDVVITPAAKIGSGHAGFDFNYLDANGSVITSATQFSNAQCVRDNVTGLIWELKTPSNAHDTYIWKPNNMAAYSALGTYFKLVNKAVADANLEQSCDPINGERGCTTSDFIQTINAAKLCGASDWGLPTANQLESIISYQGQVSYDFVNNRMYAIDSTFNRGNPNEIDPFISKSPYWTASVTPDAPIRISFVTGTVQTMWINTTQNLSNTRGAVRLVRSGKQ